MIPSVLVAGKGVKTAANKVDLTKARPGTAWAISKPPEQQRLADAFELTNFVFENMLAGPMWQKEITDRAEGWKEVRRCLNRLGRVQDAGRFTTKPPAAG